MADSSLRQDFPRLLRRLRLTPGTPEAREAEGLWSEAQVLAKPAAWRVRLGREDFLNRFHPHAQSSAHLMRILEGCPWVWLVAVTIGPEVEMRSAKYFALGRPFAGYVLDWMGTYLVEQTMRGQLRSLVNQVGEYGGEITRRYSPGYKDFALEAQEAFLAALGDAFAGLRLTGGYGMEPSKSITAVAGERDAQNQATESTRRR